MICLSSSFGMLRFINYLQEKFEVLGKFVFLFSSIHLFQNVRQLLRRTHSIVRPAARSTASTRFFRRLPNFFGSWVFRELKSEFCSSEILRGVLFSSTNFPCCSYLVFLKYPWEVSVLFFSNEKGSTIICIFAVWKKLKVNQSIMNQDTINHSGERESPTCKYSLKHGNNSVF